MVRLGVVVDDHKLGQEMVDQLTQGGFHATVVALDTPLAPHHVAENCDLLILDSQWPGGDGFRLSSQLKDSTGVGIILIGAAGSVEERIQSFRAGADLYFSKPVHYGELVAAVDSLIRRLNRRHDGTLVPHASLAAPLSGHAAAGLASSGMVNGLLDDCWVLDAVKWELIAPPGIALRLTGGEFRFLSAVMATPGQAVTRAEIIRSLGYGEMEYDPRSLDAVVRRLRRKAESRLGRPLPLRAAHSLGYVFNAPVRNNGR